MHLIILPGNSKEYNSQWLKDSAEAYKGLFESVSMHIYKHWEAGEEMIDTEIEATELKLEAKKLKGDYVIFAKSAGTVATVKAIVEGKINPKKCVFVGSPWGSFANEHIDLKEMLSKYKIPTLFIQQTDDMFFKHSKLEKTLVDEKVKNYKLIEIPGGNHAYDNYDEIKQWVKEFIEV